MSEVLGQGYGRILAEARAAKGLTVGQVADKLKLTSRQIEAIEAEDAARLPAAVFVRGFVRNYARLVDVPQGSLPVISDVPATPTETITAHSEELRFRPSPVRRWLLLPVLVFTLFLILVALLYAWLSQGEEAYVPAAPAAPVAA
ncbi:MAG: helix-turn-helix domain-containing protein, partial [Thiobacillus sp.]|nr:helix-turn-helix domain-containing protein [Thiobacillus sp.]